MRKILKTSAALFMVLVMMLAMTGCGEIENAESAVNNMFKAYKNLNFEEAQEYIIEEEVSEDSQAGLTEEMELFMKNLFDKLSYEIISSEKVDSDNVNVTTKITAIDMKVVLGDFVSAIMQYAFENAAEGLSDEEIEAQTERIFVECVEKPDLATVTNEIVIKVTKVDGKWKVVSDETLNDAILGGLAAATEELEKNFGSMAN